MEKGLREQCVKCQQFQTKFLRLRSAIQRHLARLPLVKLIAEKTREKVKKEEEKEEGEGEEKEKEEKEEGEEEEK